MKSVILSIPKVILSIGDMDNTSTLPHKLLPIVRILSIFAVFLIIMADKIVSFLCLDYEFPFEF